ncbi:MAG: XdhC family protein [Ferruginibacter sp.]
MANHANIDVWEFLADKFSADIPVMLLYVLHNEGSSPGRQGFKMGVAADGEIRGTIGGGIMEHKFAETAKSFLKDNRDEQKVYRQVHDKDAGHDRSGMICSGEQTIFLYPITTKDIPAIHELIDSAKQFQNGTLELSNTGIRFAGTGPETDFEFSKSPEGFLLKEKTGFKNSLHIIGGGHCALALSRLMSEMDFFISVYDERAGLNTMAQNVYAHQQTIVESYSELGSALQISSDDYVVIMTFGYRTDDIVLRELMGMDRKYLGVLGSAKKIEKMLAGYRMEKVSEDLLTKIHAPIGIPIKSQTTAEIAVSIAAEIIAVKNQQP